MLSNTYSSVLPRLFSHLDVSLAAQDKLPLVVEALPYTCEVELACGHHSIGKIAVAAGIDHHVCVLALEVEAHSVVLCILLVGPCELAVCSLSEMTAYSNRHGKDFAKLIIKNIKNP